jgi:hypothetical protein
MTTLRTYLQTLFAVLSTIVVISGVTPVFTMCLIPIIIFYVVEQNFFTVRIRLLMTRSRSSRTWRILTQCPFLAAYIPRAETFGLGKPQSNLRVTW